MTVNYTTNLALGQPVTGTESGTWGDDVNNSVTSYLDIAIAGGLAITITTTDVTLSLTQGTSSATNIGSTTAQYAILNVSGAMTAARNLILPSSSRQYVINNNTTGGFALTVKGAATTGVTMVNGESAHIYWNGSDYAKLSNAPGGAGTFTNLTYTGTLTGSTGVIAIGTNQIYKDSSGNVGIGTSSPSYAVDIRNAASTALRVGSNSNAFGSLLSWDNPSGTGRLWTLGAYDFVFGVNSTEQMRLTSTGLGIGTSSPNLSSSSTALTVNTGTAANYSAFELASGGTLNYHINANNSAVYHVAAGTRPWVVYTNGSERMRIDSAGNVGIGTSSPADKLQVVSSSRAIFYLDGANASGGSGGSAIILRKTGGNTAGSIANSGSLIGDSTENLLINANTNALVFSTGAGYTERMRIDSSGNVGIGTSSPAQKLQVTGKAIVGSYANTGAYGLYLRSDALSTHYNWQISTQNTIDGGFEIARSDAVGSSTFNSPSLVIDSSGNVGIGTNSPGYRLQVSSGATASTSYFSSTATPAYSTTAYNGGNARIAMFGGGASGATTGINFSQGGAFEAYFGAVQESGGAAAFVFQGYSGSAYAERMRIDSSGNLLVGTTSSSSAAKVTAVSDSNGSAYQIMMNNTNTGSGSQVSMDIYRNSTRVGYITTTNTVCAFTSVSDYRLKEDVQPMKNALAKVALLKPVTYKWKLDGSAGQGFIAHELQEVVPDCVSGEKDAVDDKGNINAQGIDTSFLVATLTAAIQEQQALITSLTARIEALEAR